MAFCSSCGHEVAEGAEVCGSCGVAVSSAPPPPDPEPPAPEAVSGYSWATTVKSPRTGGTVGGWIAAAGGFFVFMSVFLPWMSDEYQTITGWNGLDSLRECIDDGACGVGDLFVQSDPFFFNPLIPLVLGGLLVLTGILAAVMKPSSGGRSAVIGIGLVTALGAAVTALVDVFQVTTDDYFGVSIGYGIVIWLVAAVAALAGGVMSLARR